MSLLAAKIQETFVEPACERNRRKDADTRKKGCSKPPTPGAAAGGCEGRLDAARERARPSLQHRPGPRIGDDAKAALLRLRVGFE